MDIISELVLGAVVVVDGRTWTVDRIEGNSGFASNGAGKLMAFDAREIRVLGAGLLCLPGRIEAPSVNQSASVVASVAVAASTGPTLV